MTNGMDKITKDGVIWDYLRDEVRAGREEVTKADLIKVGYSVQAIENAIVEIKKEPIVQKPTLAEMSSIPVNDKNVGSIANRAKGQDTTEPLATELSDEQLIQDLSAAVERDSGDKVEFSETPSSPLVADPLISRQDRQSPPTPPSGHENLAQTIGDLSGGIPTIAPELVGGYSVNINSNSVIPDQADSSLPASSLTSATQPPTPAVTNIITKKRHGLIYKLSILVVTLAILLLIAAGVSYAMTGRWLPQTLTDLPGLSAFSFRYSKEELFPAMVANLQSIKSSGYTLTVTASYAQSKEQATTTVLNSPSELFVANAVGPMTIMAKLQGVLDDTSGAGNFSTRLGVDFDIMGVIASSMAEFRRTDGTLYGRLIKLPNLGFLDTGDIADVWVRLEKEGIEKFGLLEIMSGYLPFDTETYNAKGALGLLSDPSLYTALYEGNDEINTVNTYRYSVKPNYDTLLATLSNNDDKYDLASATEHMTIVVWIDPARALPVKMEIILKMAVAAGDIDMETELSIFDINRVATVEKPAESISITEAYTKLTGKSMDEYLEESQVSNILSLSYALDDFKKTAGAYPSSLTELRLTPNEIRAKYVETAPKNAVKAGFDFAPWADDVPIITKVPNDVYTGTDYDYSMKGSDFQVVYEIKIASSTNNAAFYNYIDGTNTMTSKAISIEAIR